MESLLLMAAWLLENKIDPTQRVETLRINDWLKLTERFEEKKRWSDFARKPHELLVGPHPTG
jgi:hypothetical protein